VAELLQRPTVIPYITAWSEERSASAGLVAIPGRGIAYVDETPYDRGADGILWTRTTVARGRSRGRPEFGRVHAGRQRRAMRRLLCQVCGGPADRTRDGVLWLLKNDCADWPGWPEGMAATHPPVCLGCAAASVRLCPHLDGGFVAVRVKDSGQHGVYGGLYRPGAGGPQAVDDVLVASDDPRARWVLATQLVRVLRACTFVDLRAEAGRRSRAA
jgi:hypothetical protein